MKHKHCELIKAWADGAEIQFKVQGSWCDIAKNDPRWIPNGEYRIKPEEKKPVVRWLWAIKTDSIGWVEGSKFLTESEAINEYKSEIKKLEYTRTEFEE